MNTRTGYPAIRTVLTSLLFGVAAVASPLASAIAPPTVTAVAPVNDATGVALDDRIVSVEFNEPVAAFTGNASFTVTCTAPCADPAGAVVLNASKTIASFVLAAGTVLDSSTRYVAKISGVESRSSGALLAQAFLWHFTTGATADSTRPQVLLTAPATTHPGPTAAPANSAITAVFSEEMTPNTIGPASFTVTCVGSCTNPAGTVTYHVGSRSATFQPAAELKLATTYTATITPQAKDLAGTSAANYAWTFKTAAATAPAALSVRSTRPADTAQHVCPKAVLNANFTVPSGMRMDPATVNASSFTLKEAAPSTVTVKAASVVIDQASGRVAIFTPLAALKGDTLYTARIKGGAAGVTDFATVGNTLPADYTWNFTTGSAGCPQPPDLGAAAPFAAFGGIATVTNDGLSTVINGDLGVDGASTKITGFRDQGANVYTVTTNNRGIVNGLVYTDSAPPGSQPGVAVAQASLDARAAFNSISPASRPGGKDVSSLAQCPSCGGAGGGADELAGRTLPPGLYKSTTGTYDIGGSGRTTADLTLDARGDSDALWVFQTSAGSGTLNVGVTGPATPAVPIKVRLVNGAQSKNVFWYVPGGAAIGTGSTMAGTLLAEASITISTTGGSPPTAVRTTLNGRAIVLSSALTMTNTVINVPAP